MDEITPPPTHKVGDEVDGFRLEVTADGLRWIRMEQGSQPTVTAVRSRRRIPLWGWVSMGAGALAVIGLVLVVAVVGAASEGGRRDPEAGSNSASERASNANTPEQAQPTTPIVSAAEDPVLGETAFGMDPDSGIGWYVVGVENPNTDYVFARGAFTVEAFDASGVLLDSDSAYTTLLAGKTMFAGDFFDLGAGQIDHIEVRGPTADAATYAAGTETGTMTSVVSGSTTEYGYTDVTGTVTSSFSEDQESVAVYVVSRDVAGAITGGGYTYIDRLPAGGTAQFSVNLGRSAEGQSFEAFATL